MFFYFWGTGRSGHVCDFHQGIANLQGSSTAAPWLFQNFAPLKPQLYETRWNEWSTSSWPSHFIIQYDLGMWNYQGFFLLCSTEHPLEAVNRCNYDCFKQKLQLGKPSSYCLGTQRSIMIFWSFHLNWTNIGNLHITKLIHIDPYWSIL